MFVERPKNAEPTKSIKKRNKGKKPFVLDERFHNANIVERFYQKKMKNWGFQLW